MATNEEIDRVIEMLSIAYPSQNLRADKDALKETVRLYRLTLRDIDGDLLRAATLQHITNAKWFPTVAELREAALNLTHFDESSAEEAWIEVKRAIRAVGYYGIPQFSDTRIKEAVSAFGWRELCGYDIEQEGVIRVHFMRIYNALQGRSRAVDSMLPEIRARIEQRNMPRLKDGKR